MVSFKIFRFQNADEEHMTREMNKWGATISNLQIVSTNVSQSQCLNQHNLVETNTTYVIAYRK